jgi:hypothetical protein
MALPFREHDPKCTLPSPQVRPQQLQPHHGVQPLPQPLANDLPNGNGSLPLLSIIGFGILVGGVISALRTRPVHK